MCRVHFPPQLGGTNPFAHVLMMGAVSVAALMLLRYIRADLSGRPPGPGLVRQAGSVALGMGMHAALGAAGGAAVAGAQGLGRRLRSGNQSTPWEQLDAATNDARGVHGAPQPGYEPVPNPGDGPDSAGPAGAAGDGPSGGGGGGGTAGATAVPSGEASGQLAASATPTGVAPILDQFMGGRAKQPAKSGRGQNNPAAGAAGLDNASAPQRDRPAARAGR